MAADIAIAVVVLALAAALGLGARVFGAPVALTVLGLACVIVGAVLWQWGPGALPGLAVVLAALFFLVPNPPPTGERTAELHRFQNHLNWLMVPMLVVIAVGWWLFW